MLWILLLIRQERGAVWQLRPWANQKDVTMGDAKKLAHTKWNCKYHMVFVPKYLWQIFYGEKKRAIGEILRKSCARKRVSIVEEECCPDHIHYVAWDAAQDEVSAFIGYLKERAARWYISSSVSWIQISQSGVLVPRLLCRHSGKNTTKITEYIRHQLVRINSENGWASRIPEAGLRTAGNSDADSCRARLVEVL